MWVTYSEVVALLEKLGVNLQDWEGGGTYPAITSIIQACQDYIEEHTGRSFDSATHSEIHDGNAGDLLVLAEYPVISITSVTVDSSILAATAYRVDLRNGRLGRIDNGKWSAGFQNIQVVYVAGYASIPTTIADALTKLAAMEVILQSPSERERDGIKSYRVLSYSVTYAPGLYQEQFAAWKAEVQATLNRYRKVKIV